MNRLRDLREDNDLLLTDVANKIGTSSMSISRYEREESALTPELIGKFCDLYDVTADYLLGRSIQPHAAVSDEDAALLAAYHAAPPSVAAAIKTLLQPYEKEEKADQAG